MQLIAVMTGDSCLSTAEIESNVSARGKKKTPVIITMCKNHIQLQYQKASKNVNINPVNWEVLITILDF